MRPLGIRLFWAAGAVLLVAVVAAGWLCPWLFPAGDEGNLYRRYESTPHLAVTFLKNYPVNDTLTVPVTLLQADSDSAWYTLLYNFGVPEEMIELYKTDKELFVGEDANSIIEIAVDKDDTRRRLPLAAPESRLIVGSIAKRSLCVFMTEDIRIKKAISLTETKKLKE